VTQYASKLTQYGYGNCNKPTLADQRLTLFVNNVSTHRDDVNSDSGGDSAQPRHSINTSASAAVFDLPPVPRDSRDDGLGAGD
jgi:hypothetical protein